MREFAVPATAEVPPMASLTDPVTTNARDYPDTVAFSRKAGDGWQPVTCRQFADEVRAVAAGLVAAGVEPGDRVGLLSATRYEWTLVDYAIWTAGAVTVPIYETSSPEQIEWILGDSGAVGVVLEHDAHRAAFDEVSGKLSDVTRVWQITTGDLDRLVESGRGVDAAAVEERRTTVTPESLATIIYTSGTTGRPKGCELTHSNFIFDTFATTQGLDQLFDADQSTLLFLPLAHVFARLIQVGCVTHRVRMGHTSDIRNLLADLAGFRPTFILSVPRVFEKVYNQAKQKAHSAGPIPGFLFDQGESTAIAVSRAVERGGPDPLLRLRHLLFDRLVYSRLREALGGRVHSAVSGGAPLGERLGHFFRGAGITVYEGYGLTETTAGATVNTPEAIRVGTVGRPVPGVTVRIADDGEILLKGGNVFKGYWHNDDATRETLEADGWFHTGDIGEVDADGYLKITGRKKELIVTAGGKNVSPAVLEDRLRAHPLVSQCMVVGDQRPFIGCLVTIDPEALPAWKSEHAKPTDASVADLCDDPDLRSAIQAAVDGANKAVSKAEAIKAFRILPVDFTEEGGQLTPTLKLKRQVVLKEFDREIDALYSGGGTKV